MRSDAIAPFIEFLSQWVFFFRQSFNGLGQYPLLGETMQGMFANDIATAFMVDLLFIVFLFLVWTFPKPANSTCRAWASSGCGRLLLGLPTGYPCFCTFGRII